MLLTGVSLNVFERHAASKNDFEIIIVYQQPSIMLNRFISATGSPMAISLHYD